MDLEASVGRVYLCWADIVLGIRIFTIWGSITKRTHPFIEVTSVVRNRFANVMHHRPSHRISTVVTVLSRKYTYWDCVFQGAGWSAEVNRLEEASKENGNDSLSYSCHKMYTFGSTNSTCNQQNQSYPLFTTLSSVRRSTKSAATRTKGQSKKSERKEPKDKSRHSKDLIGRHAFDPIAKVSYSLITYWLGQNLVVLP